MADYLSFEVLYVKIGTLLLLEKIITKKNTIVKPLHSSLHSEPKTSL